MKSDSSDKSESCCDDSDDENKEHVPVISSTSTTEDEPCYEHIEENIYLINKKKHINKEVRKMTCECELDDDDEACGENCLNRLLMIECNHRCPCGDSCTNKRFQQGCKVKIKVIKTEKKGWGVKTLEELGENQFVMEYCGEVMNYRDFQKRAQQYSRQKRKHYYFMTLRADEIIDATFKGSLSRFVNHSCEPNCVTQKWTVNGLLRIGFFTLRKIEAGEELTFDYQLQRYGKEAQTCHCEAPSCRGIIGGEKHTPLKGAVGKIVSASTSSPRRNRRKTGRTLEDDFDDTSIEDELVRLIGDHNCMMHSDQALKLSRLMVRAETTPQRIMLLKVLQNTTDQNCLKGFLGFQGLLLLWSWMVDAGSKPSSKLQLELLTTLKHLPVTTKNQLEDSKVIRIVQKWAQKDLSESEMPSSCSSQEENIDDNDRTITQEDVEAIECRKKKIGPYRQISSPGSSTKGTVDDDSSDSKKDDKLLDDLSEDEAKSTEDEHSLLSEEDSDSHVGNQASELLKLWGNLKEIYRIPKKSSKQSEAVATSTTGNISTGKSLDIEQSSSVVIRQPDSSGTIDEMQKDSFVPLPLMSLDVVKSKGDPSNSDLESKDDQESGDRMSIESPDKAIERCQAVSSVSLDATESRHQVFGYKQKMGNGMGDQGNALRGTSSKLKKVGKKSKWKGGPQGMPVNISPFGGNSNNPQVPNWQGQAQQWQKGPQDPNQGLPFFGSSEHLQYQQFGQTPMVPQANLAPGNMGPNLAVPPTFPLNLPPPNFPPPGQAYPPSSYTQTPITNMARYPTPQQAIQPQQNVFVPNYPPPQIPFQLYNPSSQFNALKTEEPPTKITKQQQQQQQPVVKDISPSKVKTRQPPLTAKLPKSTNLPPNWKTASDPQGNIYYYHTVTRKTQWELPVEEDSHDMDIQTPSDEEQSYKKKPRTPKTPPGTPPRSPLTFTTAAADTTHKGMTSQSPEFSLRPEGPKQQKRDAFRIKLSNVVVNSLNPYYKIDCKQGRITNSEDFKHLARKLTHGIMNKELQHVKSEDTLQCSDSVKVKTKEYIRNYMKKFGPIYKRT